MSDPMLPDFTFPTAVYGEGETPRDLSVWIYKGASGISHRSALEGIAEGKFGQPILTRIDVVRKIHEALINKLELGFRRRSWVCNIQKTGLLFQWADDSGYEISSEKIEEAYRHWTDSLCHRCRIVKNLTENAAYGYAVVVGRLLDAAFERHSPIIKTTRLRHTPARTRVAGVQAEKQNLEEMFALGHLMLDIADGLSVNVIWGAIPARIPLRSGIELIEWGGYDRSPRKPNKSDKPWTVRNARAAAERYSHWESTKTFQTRYVLINLRIQAEMFMLMGQPGVNLAQVHQLRMDQWSYKPSVNGYEVRSYKHRRGGSVLFEIFSEYRPIFERYIKWRSAIFPDDPDGLVFPLLGRAGKPTTRHPNQPPEFDRLRSACAKAGVKYVSPRLLRNTNVNWLLRRTQDPNLTAELRQHSTRTLLSHYEKPSLQKAMVQIKDFWEKHDPAQAAVGPGACMGAAPAPIPERHENIAPPDCLTPSGCFSCVHQRDIDSFDYIWSLASFRMLKSFELRAESKLRAGEPAQLVIERIDAKLNYIAESSPERNSWIKEALLRIDEGRYHPFWDKMIESL